MSGKNKLKILVGVAFLSGSEKFVYVATDKKRHLVAVKDVEDIIQVYKWWVKNNKRIEDTQWQKVYKFETNNELKFKEVINYINNNKILDFELPDSFTHYLRYIKFYKGNEDWREEILDERKAKSFSV